MAIVSNFCRTAVRTVLKMPMVKENIEWGRKMQDMLAIERSEL